MERCPLPAPHHPECQPLIHHPTRVILAYERNGILQRRVCIVGPHILYERTHLQPSAVDTQTQLARGNIVPRPLWQSERQEPPRPAEHRQSIQVPIRELRTVLPWHKAIHSILYHKRLNISTVLPLNFNISKYKFLSFCTSFTPTPK